MRRIGAHLPPDIDPRIRPLVIEALRQDFDTIGSCEGGPGHCPGAYVAFIPHESPSLFNKRVRDFARSVGLADFSIATTTHFNEHTGPRGSHPEVELRFSHLEVDALNERLLRRTRRATDTTPRAKLEAARKFSADDLALLSAGMDALIGLGIYFAVPERARRMKARRAMRARLQALLGETLIDTDRRKERRRKTRAGEQGRRGRK